MQQFYFTRFIHCYNLSFKALIPYLKSLHLLMAIQHIMIIGINLFEVTSHKLHVPFFYVITELFQHDFYIKSLLQNQTLRLVDENEPG